MTCASLLVLKSHTVDECNNLIDDLSVVGLRCCSFATPNRHVISSTGPFQCNNLSSFCVPTSILSCWSSPPTVPATFRVNGSFCCTGAFSGQRQESNNFQQNLSSMALTVPLTQLVWRLANIDSLRKGFVLALGASYEYRAKPAILEEGDK